MTRAVLWTVFLFIFVLWKSQDVNGCSCLVTHPQRSVCDGDFVFWGTVTEKTFENTSSSDTANNMATRVYTVKVHKVFKGSLSAEVKLETAGNSARCGVNLEKDRSYRIAGYEVDGEKRINSCNYPARIDNLSRRRRKKFFISLRKYLNNCSCKDIRTHIEGKPSVTIGCRLPKEFEAMKCFFANGICRRRRSIFCGWNQRVLKKCGSPK